MLVVPHWDRKRIARGAAPTPSLCWDQSPPASNDTASTSEPPWISKVTALLSANYGFNSTAKIPETRATLCWGESGFFPHPLGHLKYLSFMLLSSPVRDARENLNSPWKMPWVAGALKRRACTWAPCLQPRGHLAQKVGEQTAKLSSGASGVLGEGGIQATT